MKSFFQNLLRATAGGVQPTLDLHGLSVKEALRVTADFVETSFRSGISPIRIVYGKGLSSPGGRGILREVIPRWCEKEGKTRVESFKREVDLKGGDGSILLFLRKVSAPEGGSQTEKNGSASLSE
ncbi:MAG: Smr protein/MutS2 [Deltaproteobacteria bacterium]|nr:Smr protein/MutS2 [Deltaproteobacteria bacterium]MBP1719272.1 Smr protein/MutS2 [Deltaproteobacteria bacterium]